ncbi:hypothetical protein [Chlamydia caviae]|uniref:Uncharacterized protein n=1 Tax=Chlamydia caviae (strain ATCC VR-813 / DSM 19441 / 03DC25 / GPIC) TaxID=227941 RepID=Q821V9_CHLCV|nr:hypothetical protein [Chlamydia caviae]AAP05567.1 conserved hypothetical protein [Chlamydia caviae GPIC]
MRFCCFVLFLLASLPTWGKEQSLRGCEDPVYNKFSPPQHVELLNGERVYYSYHSALENAKDSGKCCIFVYFNSTSKKVWGDITKKDFCFPTELAGLFNIVVMQPGLISPTDFYPKMDPMILYMADFQDRFWELDLQNPCVILITVDSKGRDKVQRVLPVSTFISMYSRS